MINLFKASVVFDAVRYLRSPALIYVALATPIAAYYMVPRDGASYAVLSINGSNPVMTASVLGLELGVVAALLLTPLAYIFLRAGPMRQRPWQISDVTPQSRIVWALGRWVSDTFMLWALLTFLTVAGLILGLFRIGAQSNVLHTIVALWLPAAPALALVAGIRMLLDARNLTRNWFGDVIFLAVWLALIIVSTMGTGQTESGGMSSNAMVDAYGFTAPIVQAVDGPLDQVAIIGAAAGGQIAVDAWAGVTSPDYVMARGFWMAVAMSLALLAGLVWGPRKAKTRMLKANAASRGRVSVLDVPFQAPVAQSTASPNLFAIILAELAQVFQARIWLLVLAAAAVAGAVLDFRSMAGPVLLLALIFPLTEASARWQNHTLVQWLNTLGPDRLQRGLARWIAHGLIATLVLLPATVRMVLDGSTLWLAHVAIIALAVPAFIVAAGWITRSSVAARLLLLIGWYAYLSSA